MFSEFLASDSAKVSDLFRFGMVMQLPYGMERSQYYGRGPVENYSDRKECMTIGIYNDTADNQYFPYIRPKALLCQCPSLRYGGIGRGTGQNKSP